MDVCANSVFLNEEQKKFIIGEVNFLNEELFKELKKHDIIANVYYTGSMARKEPSINIVGDFSLNSDIDYVIVTSKEYIENEFLGNISVYFNNLYPNITSSFILIDTERINLVHSYMGLDLSKSIGSPVISMFEKPNFIVSQVQKNETIEAAINATACYYVHPQKSGNIENRLYRNNNYYYIKSCLECLRALYKNNHIAIEGYYDIYKKNPMHPFPFIQENDISHLIKMREMYSPAVKPPISLPDLFTNIILDYYNVNISSLYDFFLEFAQTSNDLFHSFQNAIVVLVIAQSQQQTHKKNEYLSLLSKIILNMDIKNTKYYKEYEFISKVDWNFKDWLSDEQFTKDIAYALYMFRYDYYKPLFYKNTGSRIIPDLKGVLD